jgi:hypothetical protein
MKLYSKDGVELTDNDVYFLRQKDILYLDLVGNNFNFAQVLDQYTRVAQLGLTGKVFKLKEVDSSKFSVIKMVPFGVKYEENPKIDDFLRNFNSVK